MAQTNFVKFFNKRGEDCNFIPSTTSFGKEFVGEMFFPKVSVNLIESDNLFLMQEITATYKAPQKRKLRGAAETTGGSAIVGGSDTAFTSDLVAGDTVMIGDVECEILAIYSDTSMLTDYTFAGTGSTENFYLLDYLWYNQLVSSIDVDSEELVAEFVEESGPFFFYDVSYTEELPLITKSRSFSSVITDGSGFSLDPLTGRTVIPASDNVVSPLPINLGFSSADSGVYEEALNISLRKTKRFDIDAWQDNEDGTYLLRIPYQGYTPEFDAVKNLYLARNYAGGYQYFDLKTVSVTEVGATGGTSTYIVVKEPNTSLLSTVNTSTISSYKLSLTWDEHLLELTMYGEAEGEDERLRLTLENFGRKIDEEKEFVFKDSDIKEDLTDFTLLNKKRKEMLLEGDKIFPYMGSYKALINVLNLFGYNDVAIKEYFLNVDSTSPDKGKFLAIPIAKTSAQKAIVKKVWDLVPSKIYKKTSLFGLYYHLNKKSGEYDEFGVPIVIDDSQFTAEEVLIKLFGLKELLKNEYLPLNARIYDITGEGIYFERYNFETWNDSVDVRVLEIGKRPTVTTYPSPSSYLRDLRRVDKYYVDKWTKLGFTGFLGADSPDPGLTVSDATMFDTDSDYIDPGFMISAPGYAQYSRPIEYASTGATQTIFRFNIDGDYSIEDMEAGVTWALGTTSGSLVAASETVLEYYEGVAGAYWLVLFGPLVTEPGMTASDAAVVTRTVPYDPTLSKYYPYWVGSFEKYKGSWTHRDSSWDTMPPPVIDPLYNIRSSYLKALPDDPYKVYPAGAPLLIETTFDLEWQECDFSWDQVSTLNVFLASFSVSGATATVSDLFSTVSSRGFSDGDDVTISSSPFDGTYQISGVTGNSFDITLGITPESIAGKLAYSTDISQISATTNRLSWDTVGRGEYLDMRVRVEKHGVKTYIYDSGRLPIAKFTTDSVDASTGLTYSRILDTVILPYAGEYDVSVYIYDITNNFTLSTIQYTALAGIPEITAAYQKQELYETWDDIDMGWNKVAFDWFYPAQAVSVWENANLSWDSLESYAYREQSLKKNKNILSSLAIDREAETVLIEGLTEAERGDFLYFEREATEPVLENYVIGASSITDLGVTASYHTFSFPYSGTDIPMSSRVLIKKTTDPFYAVTVGNFFYADVIGITGGNVTLTCPEHYLDGFSFSMVLYLDGGVFAGTYAIEIGATRHVGNNTLFYLKDVQKELYLLDGYFQAYLTDYDVDYAEKAIGPQSISWENAPDAQWDTMDEKSFWSLERHNVAGSGFLISKVSSTGKLQVEEFDEFTFSGDSAIDDDNPMWFFTKAGMHVAVDELNSSENEGIQKFEYELYPSAPRIVTSSLDHKVYLASTASTGTSTLLLSETPNTLAAIAQIGITVSGGMVVGATVVGSGCGYLLDPNITIESPAGGTAAVLSCSIDAGGRVQSVIIIDTGSGYTSVPEVVVDAPPNYEIGMTDMLWIGTEWRKVLSVGNSSVTLSTPISSDIVPGTFMLSPYKYHKQIYPELFGYTGPKLLNEFYYFILGKAKTPALASLLEIDFSDGVEGEWYAHPERTYSYPLKNTLLQFFDEEDLGDDAHYQYWQFNGQDFPVQVAGSTASDDDSRALYAGAYSQPFSYSDAVITPYSFEIKRSTSVIFHDDATMLPMKRERVWKIVNEETGIVQVESTSTKLFWNFYRKGKYSVTLDVKDNLGNVATGTKKSFVIVT